MTGKLGGHDFIESFATGLVGAAHRRAWWFILAYVLFTIFAIRYTGTHLGINSYIEDMIAEDLPWRQTFMEYHESFPQYVDNLLIVVDGLTPDLAQQAQYLLAAEFEDDKSGLFESVFLPGAGVFFDKNGLLYLETGELFELSDKIIELQPVLGILASNADLTGLARVFQLAADDTPQNSLTGFDKPLASFSAAALAAAAEWQFGDQYFRGLERGFRGHERLSDRTSTPPRDRPRVPVRGSSGRLCIYGQRRPPGQDRHRALKLTAHPGRLFTSRSRGRVGAIGQVLGSDRR